MSSNNYFYINSDYGYNKKDFKLIENFENTNIESKNFNCSPNISDTQLNVYNQNKFNQIDIKKVIHKQKNPVNTFPLAWTCYQKNGEWVCPMRGDKK